MKTNVNPKGEAVQNVDLDKIDQKMFIQFKRLKMFHVFHIKSLTEEVGVDDLDTENCVLSSTSVNIVFSCQNFKL